MIYYRDQQILPLRAVVSQMNPVHDIISYFFEIHFSIVACFPHAGTVEVIETSKGTQQ
jgi:hypothetical protein